MTNRNTLTLHNGVARNPLLRLAQPVDLTIRANEHIAIVGPNAGGKSLLVEMITGKSPLREGTLTYDFGPDAPTTVYENIRYIAFRDTYGSADASYYYQQRWNAHDQDEVPTARELIGPIPDEAQRRHLFELFGIEHLMDKKIILLSSGELRKFQLAKALMGAPRVLIIDNPFIGLDAETRTFLHRQLTDLSRLGSLQLILVQSMMDDVPDFITHVIPVSQGIVHPKLTRTQYLNHFLTHVDPRHREAEHALHAHLSSRIAALPMQAEHYSSAEVVRLNHVSIRYGSRTILDKLDWVVQRGEKWALTGQNGSGKSTLLSLLCADNPQSYACDISLFGRRRGTGESIWEIKKHIGYVSPEMHRAYLKNLPTIDIVASGLNDSIGLYVHPRPEQLDICQWWMDIFGIECLRERPFLQLSSGEQRLALLARAFVKDPELIILDEPLHGLDTFNRRRVKAVVEAFCQRPDKTLIMVTHYANELPKSITHRLTLERHYEEVKSEK